MAVNWEQFCGEDNFTIWNSTSNSFGRCFELVLVSGTHFLLLVASLLHFFWHRKHQIGGQIKYSNAIHFRFLISILLCTLPIVSLCVTFFYEDLTLNIVDILTFVIQALSWLSHSNFLWLLHRLFHIHVRGPPSLVISVLTTTVALAIHVRSIILDVSKDHNYLNAIDEYVSYVKCALHLGYLLSLLPSKRPSNSQRPHPNIAINAETLETDPLLPGQTPSASVDHIELHQAGQNANIFSKLFFLWTNPLMKKGYLGQVTCTNDIFHLPLNLDTHSIDLQFQKILNKTKTEGSDVSHHRPTLQHSESMEGSLYREEENKTSLIRCLHKCFGSECYSLGILKFLSDGLNFTGPILLNLLVNYMETTTEVTWHGYVYAAALFSSTFLSALLSTHFNYRMTILGLKIRAAIITSVYRKALRVSAVMLSKFSSGEVVNFMSTDTDRVVNFCPSIHQFWSLPVQVGVALFLLYQQVGLAFLAGIAFAILLIPVNKFLANKIGSLSTAMMKQKDSRVKVMCEVLLGIRVIKFCTWEGYFSNKLANLRNAELRSLRGRKYLDACCVFFWACTPSLISILTFTTYVLMGNTLTAAKVFTSIALFNILIMPLNAFPWVINGLVEAWVSIKRVQRYLQLTEQDTEAYYARQLYHCSDPMIEMTNGVFSWTNTQAETIESEQRKELPVSVVTEPPPVEDKMLSLRHINISITEGSFVGIVGRVGSGKSSLLNAILAEMNKESGIIQVSCLERGFGFVPQEAWIQHATVRENILFGKSFDPELYDSVIDACALREDLKILPAGDLTEIGENGVTLSGGQKTRVALARAVYQDKAVYLLDDPLAAVDVHVAKHLYEKCIKGLLRHKTRILVTHHTRFLRQAEHIIVLDDGCILAQGPPNRVLDSADVVGYLSKGDKSHQPKSGANANDSETEAEKNEESSDDVGGGEAALVQQEEQEVGVVRMHVYQEYWRAVGHCLAVSVLAALFFMQASRNVSDWWLSFWVIHAVPPQHGNHTPLWIQRREMSFNSVPTANDTEFYLTVYGGIVGSNLLFALARAFLFAYGGICAAKTIHNQLLSSILKARVSFFDVTPLGRIMNRFSSDVYAIDDSLPFILNIFLAQCFLLTGALAVTSYGLPWFLLALAPLTVVYYYIQRYYRATSRELKRISSVTLSPIYAHFAETVAGLVTIRALRESQRFEEENCSRLTENQRAQLSANMAGVWLAVRLQLMGVAMVTAVAFIAVLQHQHASVNPGLVGLAISYALSVTSLLSGVVQFGTETEKQFVSVERANQYIHGVPEETQSSLLLTPSEWPTQGMICFKDIVLRYREGLPNALDGVSFEVRPGEKIGIVGRTGSGKSSLFLALFRMVALQSGEITIDGVNIAHLPIHDLRSKMAIIPQDPFLFSGTVRENLDPSGRIEDSKLWQALTRCHLAEVVKRQGGLDAEVAERGRHFSAGQRQLLCLTRALLMQPKIVCLDEATASVDSKTDILLQRALHIEFAQCTVLTIAHRLHTIANSDRVLVLSGGRVAEFDSPTVLVADSSSMYHALMSSSV